MKIPNADQAIIDIVKLTGYCLNKEHPRGKHKARLFETILGLTDEDAEELQDMVLEVVKTHDAVEGKHDQYGKRYIMDFTIMRLNKQATARSTWIIRSNEDFPRLTSCYILKK
jgi:hypothetical protein